MTILRNAWREAVALWWGLRAMIWAMQWTIQGLPRSEIERLTRERLADVLQSTKDRKR